jgi:RNA polymerase sigma-70 factor (ECF subfamily)
MSRPEVEAGRTRPTLYVEPTSTARARFKDLDDAALITAYLAGCDPAFTELYDRYAGRIIGYITRLTGDREYAEDLTQETFVRIYRNLDRFDRTRKFTTWAFTIAGHLAINELRDRSRRSFLSTPLSAITAADGEHCDISFADPKSSTEKLATDRHLHELVNQTILLLQEGQRQVFVLREIEGKSYQEMADICGCNLGTIKSRLNRARNAFAAYIAPLLH